MRLRPYQLEALEKSKERYNAGISRQIITLPTGCGKTCVFASLPQFFGNHGKTLVLVHREELAQQAADKLRKWNPNCNVGIEMASKTSVPSDNIVVASVPTIGREGSARLRKFIPDEFRYIITDECHHSIAQSYKTVYNHFGFQDGKQGNRLHVGFTATPNRGDGQPLAECYDEIVYDMSILDAIQQGWLCDIRGIGVYTKTLLDKVSTRLGDFAQNELADTVNTTARNDLIVRKWLELAEWRQTVVFAVDVKHAQDLTEMFKHHGVAAAAIWASDEDRAYKLQLFAEGRLPVLVNVGILTEGYDYWGIKCILMARPTKSQLLYVQMCGRGTRIPPEVDNLKEALKRGEKPRKTDCLLIDVVDNASRHSLVTAASIFGLPKKMNLQGESVMKAAARINSALAANPALDLSNLEQLNQLDATIKAIDLFHVHYAPEVEQNSEYMWHPHPAGGYVLSLQNKETIRIAPNLLNRYDVAGTVKGQSFVQRGFKELDSAFQYADQMLSVLGRDVAMLAKRGGMRWHGEMATDSQRNLLRKLMGRVPPANLTKGEAHQLITMKLQQRRQ